MPNERLRAAMVAGGWTHVGLAEATGVDPKSVERWVNLGRIPRQATALGTTLYNSLYRADDQLLANAHVWGVNAYGAPVWHLRRNNDGGMFDTYTDSFGAVWGTAHPMES
ncbi:helix-turn-helix domain-containing protein [Streptomyces sp. NPDC004296]|uniref:helix-turn-helix domain-containing protein n=1 Tax=Streptomyces sp. NPDC004296 TaxID=3364697 RepID=UPI0036CFD757